MRALSTVTIAVLLLVTWEHRQANERYAEMIPVLEQSSERFVITSITGRIVPPSYLTWLDSESPEGGDGSGWRAIWILDVEECLGCLADLASWNRLADQIHSTLVLMGVTAIEAKALADSLGVSGAVKSDPQSASRSTFGLRLSSLRVLVHADGTVLFVDPRNPAATCYWDFPAVVERLTDPASHTPVVPSVDRFLPDALLGGQR